MDKEARFVIKRWFWFWRCIVDTAVNNRVIAICRESIAHSICYSCNAWANSPRNGKYLPPLNRFNYETWGWWERVYESKSNKTICYCTTLCGFSTAQCFEAIFGVKPTS